MKLTVIHKIFTRAIPLHTLLRSSFNSPVKSFFILTSLGSKYLQTKSCKYVSPCCKVLQNISYEDGTHLSTRSCQNLLSFSFIVSFSPWNGPSSIQHLELLACIKKEKVCVFNFNVKEIISKFKILNGTKPDAHYFNIPTVYKYTFGKPFTCINIYVTEKL